MLLLPGVSDCQQSSMLYLTVDSNFVSNPHATQERESICNYLIDLSRLEELTSHEFDLVAKFGLLKIGDNFLEL